MFFFIAIVSSKMVVFIYPPPPPHKMQNDIFTAGKEYFQKKNSTN